MPTTKSLDSIVVAALRVGFSGDSLGRATGGFACNCPVPEAWTTEASWQDRTVRHEMLQLSKDLEK